MKTRPDVALDCRRLDGAALAPDPDLRLHDQPACAIEPGTTLVLRCAAEVPGGLGAVAATPSPAGPRWGWLWADMLVEGEACGILRLEAFVRGAEGAGVEDAPRCSCSMALFPHLACRWMFDLSALEGQRLFLPRTPGRLKATCRSQQIRPAELDHIRLTFVNVAQPQRLLLGRAWLAPAQPPAWIDAPVLVDELGQWTRKTWPGKTPDPGAMARRIEQELAQPEPDWPAAWSVFGGSRAHRFEASGFFRTHHDGARWWLVDPEGCGFFSAGLDCVRPEIEGAIVAGTDKLFAWLPRGDPAFADAWRRRNHWGDPVADFGVVNLIRLFGRDWRRAWGRLTTRRLRSWGFNTVANWSDLDYARSCGLPYVVQLPGPYPGTDLRLFRDFPDVFDPAFARAAEKWSRWLAPFAGDRCLLGYFMVNEPHWGFGRFNLAAEMLETQPGTHARRELARWLAERYAGDPRRWRQSWALDDTLQSFDQLVGGCWHRLAERFPAAEADLWEFSRRMVREFVRLPAEACRRADPNHLNLGTRWAWIASDLCYEGCELVDVFSINCYQMTPDQAAIGAIARRTHKPVILGEFHFGALDRGLAGNGLRGVADQRQRGVAYRRFLEAAAAHPDLVGCHYFTLYDQATLGRFDGENWQIGFVDVCQQPYGEIAAAARASHERLYAVRGGSAPPFAEEAREVPRVAI